MTFEEILDHAIAMLQRRGRVTYRTLRLQFQLDDDHLAALKDELLFAHPQVHDEAERGLVWTGDPGSAPCAGTTRLHATLSGGEDPHLAQCPGRRAQASHRALCRPQGLDRTHC